MLKGVTVLDLSTVGPAARAARMLADYGARVIKVGAPVAAGGVQIEPPFFAYGGHRGMERVRLDLKSEDGKVAFLRLAADADVVMESFRPGVVDRLGVGYEAVKAVNPGVVYCATSGYGQSGPKSQWAGHDVNYLAAGGYFACAGRVASPAQEGRSGRWDGELTLPGATVADIAAGGMQAVVAILAALVGRAETGEGAYLDVSVADGVVGMLALLIDEHLATGVVPEPGHDILTGRYACYGLYRCADGKWVSVGAIEPKFYANLCRLLGCEQWIAHQSDDAAQDEIRADFAAAFATRTRDEWVDDLGPADTCVAPVNGIDEVVADAQVLARGDVVEAVRPSGETFRQVAAVWAGAPRPDRVEVRDPGFDDSDALLS